MLDKYVSAQWKKLDDYTSGVKSGKIVCNRWIKLAVKRFEKDLKRRDMTFDRDEVERVFKFMALININQHNKYSQFSPLPYQIFILVNMFGFFWKKTKRRRFRYSLIFQSRKNGKTLFATVLNLYFLIADSELDPQSLLLASTREQASIALEYAKTVVMNSPVLSKRVNIMQYQLRHDTKKSRGMMKTLASNSNRLDGYSPSSAILDEIHAYTDDSLFRVIKSGILARTNPMVMLISTAGFQFDSFCNDMVENMKLILQEENIDDSFFGVLYTLDEEDDYNDSSTWIKANPALGTILRMEDLKIEYDQAVNTPSQLPNFLTKNLNIFTQSTQSFIPDEILKRQSKDANLSEFIGCDMYCGLDLSSTKDLSSLVGVMVHPVTGRFAVLPFFFRANNPEKRFRKAGIDLAHWIKTKEIIECQKTTVDYDVILDTIRDLSASYNIVNLAYDKFNSALIVPEVSAMGIDTTIFAQTAASFNFPLKYLEKQIHDDNIDLSSNRCLRWNFRNVVLYIDGNGNIKVMKNKSLDAVDGVVSLAMAFGAWIEHNLSPERVGLEIYNSQQNEV